VFVEIRLGKEIDDCLCAFEGSVVTGLFCAAKSGDSWFGSPGIFTPLLVSRVRCFHV